MLGGEWCSEGARVSKIELVGTLLRGQESFSLEIECRDTETTHLRRQLFGYSTGSSACILSRFDLCLDKQPIQIPQESYEDLANPNFLGGVGIIEGQHPLTLVLHGGDGENSYVAEFEFGDNRLKQRRVTTRDEYGHATVSVKDFDREPRVSDRP